MNAATNGRLEGRVAVVVGAGGFIADAIAQRIAEEEALVSLVGFPPERLEESARALANETGTEPLRVDCDIAQYGAIQNAVDTILERYDRIDVLINASWGHKFGLIGEFGEENWDHDLSVNLKTTFATIEAVAPGMRSRQYGRIVNLASTAKDGVPWFSHRGHAAHAAARGGVHGFTRALAFELGGDGVTVNCVVAGPTLTPKSERVFASLREDPNVTVYPTDIMALHKLGEPRDVANAVLFLASDEAKHITGESLYVSGGLYG
jgi:NAD(P)-dependent dehydrogenase (short-subunit alcohol dehydrogenase family)